MTTTITTFAEAQEVLAAHLPGYTARPAQVALAAEIEAALAGDKHGLMQAGTGTGKSLAILIPLILRARATGQRSVVSTFTKALQNQYADKDLPFLQAHLGIDFTWAVLKGRSNYPCQARALEIQSPTPAQRDVLDQMKALSTPQAVIEGSLCDRESFPALTDQEWRPFAMSASECPGAKSCPFARECFAERAKEKAAGSDIVITNTAYLMQDLVLRMATGGNVALLGEVGAVAVDEAHTLPDSATGALEDTMSDGTLIKLARDITGYLMETDPRGELGREVEEAVTALWGRLITRYAAFVESQRGKTDPMPLTRRVIFEELGEEIRELCHSILAARDEIKSSRPALDGEKIARQRLMRRTETWVQRLENFVTDEPEKTVRWAEQITDTFRGQTRRRVILRSAPVSVAGFLREAMWSQFPVIMSSATLTSGTRRDGTPDFEYLAQSLGLGADEALTFDAGSPFDFPRQARLFVPGSDFPAPERQNMAAWRVAAQATTRELVRRSGGGALLLFTSGSAMREAYDALAGQFQADGLTVLRQGDYPTPELVRRFREDGNAVLFALRTFFEGIDVQGRALRLVVLDKLPFAVPTDLLYQARCEAINRRYNDRWASFTRLTIPMMVLILTQAFGRLIRHIDDQGVVAILDSRLETKRYGATILKALPPATRVSSVAAAGEFLEQIG